MIKHSIALFVASLAGPLSVSPAAAQSEPLRELCVDRPGKDTPPCIVDKGHAVVEVGAFHYSREDEAKRSEYDFGETLVRFGLTDTAELQVGFTPYSVVRLTDETTGRRRTIRGAGDVTGGLKLNFLNPDGSGTAVAAQAFVTAPTGKDEIGAGAWEGGLIVPMAFELPEEVGLTVDPEIDLRANQSGNGHHMAYAGVVSLSRELGSGVEGSAEIWSMVDNDPDGHSTEASFDLSAAWTPEGRSNLQFDAEADLGLTRETPAIEATAGVAYRF